MKDFFRKIMDIGIKFKNLSAIAIATLIGNAISAVFWLVLASMMGAEQYGEINYFIAIASVASAISFLGAGNALTVFSAKEK
jgi:O-antigen/teichoic acid export membrane protein